jgi:GT2 family glycosyltransferase
VKASLIIPFYKDIQALELILLSLNRQSAKGMFELVLAEDDNATETVNFLEKIKPSLLFPVQHVSQPDEGYRRAKALNNGIAAAQNPLLIFSDGDCILHTHFIKSYLQRAGQNIFLYGRRVNLGQAFSEALRQSKDITTLNMPSLFGKGNSRIAEGFYLPFYPGFLKSKRQPWGCNMGMLKNDIEAVNGFDEDYKEWGPEDLDVFWRMKQNGCQSRSLKYNAIMYHLYHPTRGLTEVAERGKKMFNDKVKAGHIICRNGLVKIN